MKTSLSHLPLHKQDQLQKLAALFRGVDEVEQVILFGSYARGTWVEDRNTGYFSDYDLLVIVEDPAMAAPELAVWERLEKQAQAIAGDVPVTVIVHDIRELNLELRRGRYFFVDILNEGVVLYDSKRLSLAKPKALTREERLQMARDYYDYWYASASQFWQGVGYFMRQDDLRAAAFLLHQSAERFFHTVLLVFTAYKSRTHDLEKLSNQAARLHAAMRGALPRAAGEQRQLFTLLKRAYIEARYSRSYRITLEQLTTLREQVQDLAGLVRQACLEELTSLGFDRPEELATPPNASDDYEAVPPPADLTDAAAVERWKQQLLTSAHAVGRKQGRAEGLEEGRAEGLEEGEQRGLAKGHAKGLQEGLTQGMQVGRAEGRAAAIVDVLGWRGVMLSEEERDRILQIRDEVTLDRLWQRARVAGTAAELFADGDSDS